MTQNEFRHLNEKEIDDIIERVSREAMNNPDPVVSIFFMDAYIAMLTLKGRVTEETHSFLEEQKDAKIARAFTVKMGKELHVLKERAAWLSAQLDTRNADLSATIAEKEEALAKVNSLRTQLDNGSAAYHRTNEELREAREDVNRLAKEVKAVRGAAIKVETISSKEAELQRLNEQLYGINAMLREERNGAREDARKQKRELKELSVKYNDSIRDYQDKAAELGAALGLNDNLKAQIELKDTMLRNRHAQVEDFNKDLSEAKVRLYKMTQEIDSLKNTIASQSLQNGNLSQLLNATKRMLEEEKAATEAWRRYDALNADAVNENDKALNRLSDKIGALHELIRSMYRDAKANKSKGAYERGKFTAFKLLLDALNLAE